MITPDRFRSCYPQPGITKAVYAPLGRADRDRRMRAITELERRISALEIPELGHSTVSEHADAHVLDSSTLAVVIVCGHNIRLIERAIRAHTTDTAEVQIERDIITITL